MFVVGMSSFFGNSAELPVIPEERPLSMEIEQMLRDLDESPEKIEACLADLQHHSYDFCGKLSSLKKPLERVMQNIEKCDLDVPDNELIDFSAKITNTDKRKANFIAQLIKNYRGRN